MPVLIVVLLLLAGCALPEVTVRFAVLEHGQPATLPTASPSPTPTPKASLSPSAVPPSDAQPQPSASTAPAGGGGGVSAPSTDLTGQFGGF